MIRTLKYRMYPSPKQVTIIEQQFGLCRWLHNTALEHRISSFKGGKPIKYIDQQNELPQIKGAFPQFKEVHSQVLQDVLKRIDKSFKAFFRRCKEGEEPGFPRFKGKDRFNSITYPQSGFVVNGSRINLSGIGKIRLRVHRDITKGAKVKTCGIKKYGNQWYCTLTIEIKDTDITKKAVSCAVGIDLGLESFAHLTNGDKILNPRWLRRSEEKLKDIQFEYSIKKANSKKQKLTNLHRKIANQRNDFLHKESRKLVNNFDLIAYEDLSIKNMTKGGKFNKSIHDASWGKFIGMIKYKAESAGTYAIAVNPRNTSKICSNCGTIVKKELSQRIHNCHVCGISIHRDLNAAHNILRLGTDLIKEWFT